VPAKAREKHAQLAEQIEEHRFRYYVKDARTGPPAAAFGHPRCPIACPRPLPRRSETGTPPRERAHTGSIEPATGLVSAAYPL
ncbi:hypothetical protein ABZ027_37270, partial [Streptomyces sp. NPDC006332]|uniref:hypothetical protein n=1 Tax=Streptomyces sp. NPDC006332 TaxID=3155456 RepID=UPI0033B7FC87